MMISLYGEQPGRDKEAAKTVRSKRREALSKAQFDQLAEPVEVNLSN